jgi:hypothetical protein
MEDVGRSSSRAVMGSVLALAVLAGPALGQFGAFNWTLGGSPAGSGEITAEGLTVVGPDGGGGHDIWTAFETSVAAALSLHVEVTFEDHDAWPGPNCFDAPALIVDGVVHVPPDGACSENGWPSGEYVFDLEIPAGATFGLGVWSSDADLGPGVAHFHDLQVEVVPMTTVPGAIDPRVWWDVTGPSNTGRALGLVGDFDGDGVPDVAVGAPGTPTSTPPGRVEVRSGADGSLLFERLGAKSFGSAMIGGDDVTGDGVIDLFVGAPLDDGGEGQPQAGWVFLIDGATTSTVWSTEGPAGSKALGQSLALTVDVDGDGLRDVLAGAPGGSPAVVARVLVLSAATGEILSSLPSPWPELRFGSDLASADVNGDGVEDQVIGAPYTLASQPGPAGRVTVLDGVDGSDVWTAEAPGTFGSALALGPDLDGDGVHELAVGAPGGVSLGAAPGDAFVLDGATGLILASVSGIAPSEVFGSSVALTDDLDGDGAPEVVVAAQESQRAYVFALPGLDLVFELPLGPGVGARQLATPGDLDGDGQPELVTGAQGLARAWHGLQRPGPPALDASGPLVSGSAVELIVSDGPPGAPGVLFAGPWAAGLPFAGGVLIPQPDVSLPLELNASGSFTAVARWPDPLGSWWAVWLQAWLADPYGPGGATSTDAVVFSGD